MRSLLILLILTLSSPALAQTITGDRGSALAVESVAGFNEPWAIAPLSASEYLVTEKRGKLWRVDLDGNKSEVHGIPDVAYGGQGGLGDVALHPDFDSNALIYFSAAIFDTSDRARGAAVFRGRLVDDRLRDVEEIWRQTPFTQGRGHYSHRLAFSTEVDTGRIVLFITSGDRQLIDPAQDMTSSMGKLIRLYDDGSIPPSNPFSGADAPTNAFWSAGHRNALGLDFDADGRLWSVEMGPADGDELNLIKRGENYGWPIVSEGNHYNGRKIPAHDTRPEFEAPVTYWVPTIAPSSISIMPAGEGDDWGGDAFVSGLRSQSLFRLELSDKNVANQEVFRFGSRLRSVLAISDEQILILQDGAQARLLVASKVAN